ncbi:ATP-binding protein [Streptomyces somaliensis DSM 40738]|uniref:ATP-binding protein n=1 Tax=Streptomyces somaliensis (strain ATCC 33201 / DSM 40738 / JCM 12659 / KCTC 9044 / NCTC 11332 / NRRL B-12077 / IP 733) TaxID=1134445 RepID=A0AA44DCC9_STRE0|nr:MULTISPECIES: ATP-binding protein [Streptomyces]MCQ0023456.1 ATP-binding protein [Streptomyces somaliensis DSM 40738]NKY14278.1 ATP-binding protein [Streptomyces somaliensis DSM 40738]URM89428.1 ATP-binding protein [Streptomyces sp. MRC013]
MVETLVRGKPAFTECLPRRAESAGAARRLVDRALRLWGLEVVTDSAQLVVTELVANAVNHGRRDTIRVTASRVDRSVVQVAVVDLSRILPALLLRPVVDLAESGRGLLIVEALCPGRWGVEPLRWGKRVWANLDADAEAPGG